MDKLYHGTSAAILPKLKAQGIAPRAITKARDNWKHTVTSNKDAVYLTTSYPWHFASHASKGKESGLILEIDRTLLLPWKLCPDEDFLEQATRKIPPTPDRPHFAPIEWDMKKRTRHYRTKVAPFNPQDAAISLREMGTASYYGEIPWSAVTRYVIIDWPKTDLEIRVRCMDSQVSIENHRILQDRHKAFTKWFFNDPVTSAEVTGMPTNEGDDKWINMATKANNAMAEIMFKRDGLTVFHTAKEKLNAVA